MARSSSRRSPAPARLDPTIRTQEGRIRGFEFQRLRVFDAAADAATEINRLMRKVPVFHRVLRDQLSRASISVALNIAEGADEYSAREKVRFYRMARRSAGESAGAMELLARFGVLNRQEMLRALDLLNQTAAMLSSMMVKLEQSPDSRLAADFGHDAATRPGDHPGRETQNGPGAQTLPYPHRGPGPGPGPQSGY